MTALEGMRLERLTMHAGWYKQFLNGNSGVRAILVRKGQAIAESSVNVFGEVQGAPMEVDVFDDDRQGRDRIGVVGHHPTVTGRRAMPAALLTGIDAARAVP